MYVNKCHCDLFDAEAVTVCPTGPTEQNMTVPRDWFAELLERWRGEIASEPFRHSVELREAIRAWVDRQQAGAESVDLVDGSRPNDE